MEKTLLWFETSAAILLVQATIAACIARLSRRSIRWLLYVFLCLPGLGGFALLTAFVARWRFGFGAVHFPFYYVALLAVVYLTGIAVIGWKVMRTPRGSVEPPAANWPRGKLAVAAAVAVVLQSTTFSNLDLAVKERITRWQLEAAALAQSVAPSRPADAENAAPLYLEAIHNFKADPATDFPVWRQPAIGNTTLNLNDPVLRKFLTRHDADFKRLREAAGRPRCYFVHEYGRPRVDIRLPETQEMMFVAVMLYVDARVHAADGDLHTAAQDLSALFRLSRHVTEEPFLVSGLVAAAIHSVAARTLAQVLSSTSPTGEQLAAFEIPGDLSFGRLVRRCMIFEEAIAVGGSVEMLTDPLPGEAEDVFAPATVALGPGGAPRRWPDPLGMPLPLSPRIRVLLPPYRVFLLPHEVLSLRNHFQDLRDASLLLSSGLPGSNRRFRESAEKLQNDMQSKSAGLLPPLVWPALWRFVVDFQVADTRTDLARLVLAAARYRAKNGKLPDSLGGLVPQDIAAVPIDAFSGQPIQLQIEKNAWTVSSSGTDDAGKPVQLTLH
jgi:hypothetical protein